MYYIYIYIQYIHLQWDTYVNGVWWGYVTYLNTPSGNDSAFCYWSHGHSIRVRFPMKNGDFQCLCKLSPEGIVASESTNALQQNSLHLFTPWLRNIYQHLTPKNMYLHSIHTILAAWSITKLNTPFSQKHQQLPISNVNRIVLLIPKWHKARESVCRLDSPP